MASQCNLLITYALFLLLNFLTCPISVVVGIFSQDGTLDVNIHSLLPGDVCSTSKDPDPSSLELIHLHGPCASASINQNPTQISINDQHRVDLLHYKANEHTKLHKAAKIPARLGLYIGSGNYVVTVGFGTPKVKQTVVFDTGSDVTWIQCQPCVSTCYNQSERLFDPSHSSTYHNISCSSKYCSELATSGCSGSTCLYGIGYADGSQTVGFYAQDTLTLTRKDAVKQFRFGCGEQNFGLFGQVAGLMGLGRAEDSIVLQTQGKYEGVFSYCLPPDSSSKGYLKFGGSSVPSNMQFTPMLTNPQLPTFYFLELIAITVQGKKLKIPPTLFSNAGVLIDSGTVITRLPPTAYVALRSAFSKRMKKYPTAPSPGLLDTCYDFSKFKTVKIPQVSLNFRGAAVDLDASGILYTISSAQVCLAFAPNNNDTDIVIIGNTQQRTFNVVYDLQKKHIGFGSGGC